MEDASWFDKLIDGVGITLLVLFRAGWNGARCGIKLNWNEEIILENVMIKSIYWDGGEDETGSCGVLEEQGCREKREKNVVPCRSV